MIALIFPLPHKFIGLQYEHAHKTLAKVRGMRVTLETKIATRQRILEAARKLFLSKGFEAATTRDIADEAGIATGTLFNYFSTKEAILAALATEATAGMDADLDETTPHGSFEEELFAFVAAGLRKLRSLRKQLPVLLETVLSPLANNSGDQAQSLRLAHLETVARLAKGYRQEELSPVALQLYWTLYTGVLTFWAKDRSPKQEDTLALLDNSLSMFVGWLGKEKEEVTIATQREQS
ncbi:MAG TPA: TetR/AcrR family transcriptional regulator [Gemmataceae bacterium]|nr:TetR/AcrR family transcriptional regulator [Gemmataceae bacterium]